MNWLEYIFRINVLISSTCSYTNNWEISSFWVAEWFWLYKSVQRVTWWANVVAMELLKLWFLTFLLQINKRNIFYIIHVENWHYAVAIVGKWMANNPKKTIYFVATTRHPYVHSHGKLQKEKWIQITFRCTN